MISVMMRKKIKQAALALMLGVPSWGLAQTGQSLLGNPLLSPEKIKEVKRQIVEAAHKELAQPPSPAPLPAPLPPVSPPVMVNSIMPPGMASGDSARQALSRLQVMTIIGDTALIATQAPVSSNSLSPPMSMSQTPSGQMQQIQGNQPGMATPQAAQPLQNTNYARRTSSIFIKHHSIALIEGFEVIPVVNGDSVRLLLKSMPNEIVFSGSIQPALYSPSAAVAAGDIQKSSPEYISLSKPDVTSMTGASGYPAAANMPGIPMQQGAQFPVQQR